MDKKELIKFNFTTLNGEKYFEIPERSLSSSTKVIISLLCEIVTSTTEMLKELQSVK